jgi:transcription initiation factor IIE alpha subunit
MNSKCPHCKSFSFELVEHVPARSNYKLWFVQCSVCKAPIGAMEYMNSGVGINNLNVKIEKLENKIDEIERLLRRKLN